MHLWGGLMSVRGERGQAATAVSLKNSPSCFSDYQHCKLGNRPSARKGLYANCKVRTIYFPALTNPARFFNRILVFAILFSLSGVWMFLFTTHPLSSQLYLVLGDSRAQGVDQIQLHRRKKLNEAQKSFRKFYCLKTTCNFCQQIYSYVRTYPLVFSFHLSLFSLWRPFWLSSDGCVSA